MREMQQARGGSYVVGVFVAGVVFGCTSPVESPAASAPLSHASSIAVDETGIYWIGGLGVGNLIQRRDKSGGAASVLATDPCGAVGSLAVDDGYVYWSRGYTSVGCSASISRVPKGGGSIEVLAPGLIFNEQGRIVLHDQSVYFVACALTPSELVSGSDGSGNARSTVYSVAKSGGTLVPIAGPVARGAPAVGGESVYWLSVPGGQAPYGTPMPTSIMRTDGDGTTTTLAMVEGYVPSLAFFGNRIYWVVSGRHGPGGGCFSCDQPPVVDSMGPGDRTPVPEVMLAPGVAIHDLIVDATGLWLSLEGTQSGIVVDHPTVDDHTGSLVHVPHGGSPATALTGLPAAGDLTGDATAVFATGDDAPQLFAK